MKLNLICFVRTNKEGILAFLSSCSFPSIAGLSVKQFLNSFNSSLEKNSTLSLAWFDGVIFSKIS